MTSTPSRISLLVDFAFKLAFANPEHTGPLIALLNAILQPGSPIEEIELLNPFNEKEFEGDKLSVLDIKARDARGSWFNVEMQLTTSEGLCNRMVFYACSLYVQQLMEGHDYTELRPAYTICLLDDTLWREDINSHHRFRFEDRRTGRTLEETIEIHFLELPKYNTKEVELAKATSVERWMYLLRHGQEYSVEQLRELFPTSEYNEVIDTVEEIQMRTEYRELYDARQKAKLDEAWRIAAAERKGRQEGHQEGHQEGRQEGLKEGRGEGREEGELFGKLRMLQTLLNQTPSTDEALKSKTRRELEELALELQAQLRRRLG